jgi:tRNA(Ile)-lysidine synthase
LGFFTVSVLDFLIAHLNLFRISGFGFRIFRLSAYAMMQLMPLVKKLRPFCDRWARGEPALIGVSGGVDSVVLLDVLTRLEFAKLVVCHLHHGLRGGEADTDEVFVRALADRYHCDAEHRRTDVAALAEATGDSLETAGRNARRTFFAEVAAARGISRVFLAHHADDQAETVLMSLLRGAGLNGLAAMREVSEGGPHWQIVRPLLTVTRAEILGHARIHALEWRDDASNASRSHLRNRLRHDALPALSAALGRDARPALVRTAHLLAEDDAWMNEQADLTRIALEYEDGKLSVTALRQVPTALTRRILRSWLRRQGVPNVGFDEVEQALVLLGATGPPSSLNLPGAWRLRRRAGLLFLDQPGRPSSKRRAR